MVNARLAVLGSPIEHSKSPAIHAAAYEHLGLDWDYARYDIEQGALAGFLALRDDSWRGFSVTMPLKTDALDAATVISPAAQASGVANTLLNLGDGWGGFNTDIFGLKMALGAAELTDINSISVIGAGSTAASAVIALQESFPSAKITLRARDRNKAAELSSRLGISAEIKEIHCENQFDLTISTLPSGIFSPKTGQRGVLLDVAYNPWPSKASLSYERSISGLEMLLWQALAQVRIFVSGDENAALADEPSLLAAMRAAL